MTDDKGNKSKEILIENKPPKIRLFSRGETDTVKIIAKPLGTLIKLTVGHRLRRGATQKRSLEEQKWHLHEVTVKNLDSEDR